MTMRTLLAAALVSLLVAFPAASDTDLGSPLRTTLGEEVFARCGLDRLEPDQLEALAVHLAPPPVSFVEQSALLFLESEGWRRIAIHPGYREDPGREFSDIRHLASAPPDILILETSRTDEVLPPGIYLAKLSAFMADVLDSHGEVRSFRIELRR